MAAAAASFPFCRCFKVKLAGDEVDGARICAVSAAAPEATLWLDANQSYAPARAAALSRQVRDVPRIFCLEQPVRSIDWFGMQKCGEGRAAARDRRGRLLFFRRGTNGRVRCADLMVPKVCKSGGLRECLRSAAVAEAHGIGLLGSGLTESGIGLTASVHLFSTLETLLPPELNGPEFLEDLMVEGLEVDGATVRVPDAPGLGVRVNEEKIRSHAF